MKKLIFILFLLLVLIPISYSNNISIDLELSKIIYSANEDVLLINSLINNSGLSNFSGLINTYVQYYNTSSSSWETIVSNDDSLVGYWPFENETYNGHMLKM